MTTEATAPKKPHNSPASKEPPTAYAMAAGVARHVELRNLAMISMAADLKVPFGDALAAMTKGEVEAALDWKTNHSLSPDARALTTIADYKVHISLRGSDRVLIAISAKYQLDYGLDSPPPEPERTKLLDAFAAVNGVFNSWPYLREMVQNACARMTLPPVLLPVYRAQNPPKRESDAKPTLSAATAPAQAASSSE